jgi:ATP-dependent DNA helicase RecQ
MTPELPTNVLSAIATHWGFRVLRPLQTEAIQAVLSGRDSLVVMPTGGGKSLCYQAPAIARDGLTVVVSPLIALMKDQVDGLARNGIAAVRLDSSLTADERSDAATRISTGTIKLAFLSPERLVNTETHRLLNRAGVNAVAIDEAHCISHWGHDFRPEYRMLAKLRELFPKASLHAYTATATEQVRRDIVQQLNLKSPQIYVGNFDRPNLTYRVLPQRDVVTQVREVLDRHKDEAGIVYCLRRVDVDGLTETLKQAKYKAVPYHAGMTPEARKKSHDAFASEEADVVVATIAFGMGIDRSNVRFVVHACVPKTIEHYQQETGRAGRDGLPSECTLLFSLADVMALKRIVKKSAMDAGATAEHIRSVDGQIEQMARYASGSVCRHKALVNHFGQPFEKSNCQACDVCLGETETLPDSTVVAKKILSCVARVKENYGANHVIDVLRGADTETIRSNGHDKLTTYGLLKSMPKMEVRDYLFQLVGQNVLTQSEGEYPVLKLNDASWLVMKGQQHVRLIQRSQQAGKPEKGTLPAGIDPALFERLRQLRKEHAQRLTVPAFQIFSDAVLVELSRGRPSTLERMRMVSGIGDVKLRDFGQSFLDVILDQAKHHNLKLDVPFTRETALPAPATKMTATKHASFNLFRERCTVEDVMHQTKLARSTITDHLADYIRAERPRSIATWVPADIVAQVQAAAEIHGRERLKPVFLALNEQVSYDLIRIVFAYLESSQTD